MGKWKDVHMLFESNGRGVVLQSLNTRYGENVCVLRLKHDFNDKKKSVFNEAIALASDPQATYDYWAVVKYIIPQAILRKLHLDKFIPVGWERDIRHICSEAVFEVFVRGGIKNLLPNSEALASLLNINFEYLWRKISHIKTKKPLKCPIPEDFITSPCLQVLGDIILTGKNIKE